MAESFKLAEKHKTPGAEFPHRGFYCLLTDKTVLCSLALACAAEQLDLLLALILDRLYTRSQ